MPLDPHEYNIALHLAAAGERARSAASATPNSSFAASLRARLLSPLPSPLPSPPPDLALERTRRSREPRIRPVWSPSIFGVPRLLPIALAAVVIFASLVAARQLYVAIADRLGPARGGSLAAVLPLQSASASSFERTSRASSSAPSSAPTSVPRGGPAPGTSVEPTNHATPTPTPRSTPVATSVGTPVPTPVPTQVPTPTPGPVVPGAPTQLVALPGGGSGEISLSWLAPVNDGGDPIIGYNVCQADQPGGPYTCSSTGSTAAATTISGLTPGTQYWYRVEAVNGVGSGALSNEDTAVATP